MKLIASQIKNLTDARYFAAMNIDWLCYDLRPGAGISISEAHAMADWVEGPSVCIDVRGADENLLINAIVEISADALIVDPDAVVPDQYTGIIIRPWKHDQPARNSDLHTEIMYVVSLDSKTKLDDITNLPSPYNGVSEVWLDINLVSDNLEDITQRQLADGIVLHGGDELATGVKSYEELDRIIEFVQAE